MFFWRYYLWIAPHLILGMVVVFSLRRKLARQLPLFFSFAAFEVFQFLTLLALSRAPYKSVLETYRWALVLGSGISVVLELGVLYELANNLFFSRVSLARVMRPVFSGALVLLIMVSAVVSGVLGDIGRQRVVNLFQVIDFSSSLIQVGMLLVLFLFSRVLNLSWRSWPTGVALGFGISACINLAAAAFRAGIGHAAFIAVDVTDMVAFHVAVLVWAVYLFLPDQKPALANMGLLKSDIQFWDQELQRITGP